MGEQQEPLQVRLSPKLSATVRDMATREKRSATQQVEYLVELAVEEFERRAQRA